MCRAGFFPESQKAAEDMQAFAKLNEQRLYKLMGTCMDPQTDLKGLVKAMVRKNKGLIHRGSWFSIAPE